MSFQQALSGLNASSKNLDVIGNNVANAQTYGTKTSRAEFSDVYASATSGAGSNAVGIGVSLSSVSQQFSQGNVTTTDNPMDLAINGGGFFQVSDGKSPTAYTRNGQFKIDRDGYVINSQQQKLLGYPANAQGVIVPGLAKPITLPTAGIDPFATDRIGIEFNLDAREATTLPAAAPLIDLDNPKTFNRATSVTVYDAKGQDVAMTYYFQKTATDTWNVYATANGNSLASESDGTPAPITTLQFPSNGAAPTSPAAPILIDVPGTTRTGGGETLPITGIKLDLTQATQYGAGFGVTKLTQSGYAPGQLTGVGIETNGIVMARYSNGQSKPAGQIELANFRNNQGLQPIGGNAWASTYTSGDPVLGAAGDGNFGVLQSGALEESNVDLTGELVAMMTAQRSYQANAQTIKTQDSVLQTLVNLR